MSKPVSPSPSPDQSTRRPRQARPIRRRKAHFQAVVAGEEYRFCWDPSRFNGVLIVRKKHARQLLQISVLQLVNLAAPQPELFPWLPRP